MIRHIVMFKFMDNADGKTAMENAAEAKVRALALKEKVPVTKQRRQYQKTVQKLFRQLFHLRLMSIKNTEALYLKLRPEDIVRIFLE